MAINSFFFFGFTWRPSGHQVVLILDYKWDYQETPNGHQVVYILDCQRPHDGPH